MTTGPRDWTRGPAMHGGGQPGHDSHGPSGPPQQPYGQSAQPYGQAQYVQPSQGQQGGYGQPQGPYGAQPNPYATGPGPEAAAHYDPSAPRVTNGNGSPSQRRPGLRALAVLLVLGSLVFLVWHFATWGPSIGDAIQLENCPTPDQRMNCLANDGIHRWVYAPLLAVTISWAFASGASVEAKQGRARGYLHLLAGIAALAIAVVVSGS